MSRIPVEDDSAVTRFHLDDLQVAAAHVLPSQVWDFVAGGSGRERTLAANRAALDRLYVMPRVMTDVSAVTMGTELLGTKASLPVAVAPMAYQRLLHPEGELASAAAAAAAGIPFTVSTLSSYRMEDIAAVGGVTWFQLYWLRDRGLVTELVRRAEDSGCRALLVTVDVSEMGRRFRDLRNGFALPPEVTAANLAPQNASGAHERGGTGSALATHTRALFHPGVTWDDLAWLRERTRLPLVLKGVLDPDDADLAATLGVAGLVVSNHGGRQLDGAIPSIEALPAVRDAVAGRCALLLDSGIRSGEDVLKALALGASGVLLGRPVLWGLALDGEYGVREALSMLSAELSSAMTLAGCPDVPTTRRLRVVADSRPDGSDRWEGI
ncbi:alpha-hydroxy-acid oxidizing enzyme [Longimycelium tulufanense]|uniref:Alpha-hydroxy-acid oxidizing enzyme n=1 Tax=Longimycelium tulufanense TaxID=907463 RepID=A0A8J3CAC7_9PSEU|nr:alpha-hydroxy acid oxidase [Longimycelium tulufanense]GGM50060.1 alpha-hydroxy-acid oxidizing enzyme [Longimycelium tulufanense]